MTVCTAIKLAEAALNLAKLNLSYTIIRATTDGVTGRKDIHEGQLVQSGQTLVTLVDGTEKWVIANYKETQTTDMQKGQLVKIQVDAIPGIEYEGQISSISDATGSFYSVIPQDNSAGNFVKVEQRIPVRIEFTHNNRPEDLERLRAGMNENLGAHLTVASIAKQVHMSVSHFSRIFKQQTGYSPYDYVLVTRKPVEGN